MAKRTDQQPTKVPFGATPAGQPPSVREWANRFVWTDRMLTALEQGVRGGKWHTLIDKVYQPINLGVASMVVLGNQGAAGVDHQTVADFGARGELRLPRKKSLDKLKDTIRARTRRTHGHSLMETIRSLTATLQGWFGYFRHCHGTVFTTLDSWIRGRLRSILRKRAGRQGRGRGADHQRWPNQYFADQGLYSLKAAHGRWCQSLTG